MLKSLFSILISFVFATNILAEEASSFSQSKALAEKHNKPILMDFMTQWWGSCNVFARAANSDQEIINELKKVILLKIDCENGEGIQLAKKFKVSSYPTFILTNSNGQTIYRWPGFTKTLFLEKIGVGLADLSTIEQKIKRFKLFKLHRLRFLRV